MNLFDDVLSKLGGDAAGGGGGQRLAASVLELLSNRQGGISGLVETFKQNGLGDIVSSWIGTGSNMPVSAEQIGLEFARSRALGLFSRGKSGC